MVITEFDTGDPEATLHALAAEILNYRRAMRLLVEAIGWADAGAPFALIPPVLAGVRGARPKRSTSRRRRRSRLQAWPLLRPFSKPYPSPRLRAEGARR